MYSKSVFHFQRQKSAFYAHSWTLTIPGRSCAPSTFGTLLPRLPYLPLIALFASTPLRPTSHPTTCLPTTIILPRREAEIEVSPAWKFTDPIENSIQRVLRKGGGRPRGKWGCHGSGSRGAELIREGWKRDFPNARQPAEPNVIMRGEDFIIGRRTA